MTKRPYQQCTHCIMDTTDPEITFDENGVCNYCRYFDENAINNWFPDEKGRRKLDAIVEQIKLEGGGKEYDCAMGLSGGVDSSYMAYQAKKIGLRPLAIHVDAGWNSELAVKNIENLVKTLCIDLYTHVIEWEEMRDLQVAYLRSGLGNQDTPQDHAFIAALYSTANAHRIKYILSGGNSATESVLPASWDYNAIDLRQLKSVHKRFGQLKLRTFPMISFFKYYYYYPFVKRIKVVRILDYMPYNKENAIQTLEKEIGWKPYEGKHNESRFTKFFQSYFQPMKFGYDKRKPHLSSLILSGQITRDRALREMEKELYPPDQLREDRMFVIKKLRLTEKEFDDLLQMPNKSFRDYPSNYYLFVMKNFLKKVINRLQKARDK